MRTEAMRRPQHSWVARLRPVRMNAQVVEVTCADGPRDLLRFMQDRQKEQLADWLGSIMNQRVQVRVVDPGDDAPAAPPSDSFGPARARAGQRLQEAMAQPLVRELISFFDASLVDVRPASGAASASTQLDHEPAPDTGDDDDSTQHSDP